MKIAGFFTVLFCITATQASQYHRDQCAYNNPCKNGAQCISDRYGGVKCICKPGFKGKYCQINIDDCYPNPCQNGGWCQDLVNDFKCQCRAGFTGKTCQTNIDDCYPNPCKNGGWCTDLVNDFKCECQKGYTGKTCERKAYNPCTSQPCKKGYCQVVYDSYGRQTFKCICKRGYTGKRCDQYRTHRTYKSHGGRQYHQRLYHQRQQPTYNSHYGY